MVYRGRVVVAPHVAAFLIVGAGAWLWATAAPPPPRPWVVAHRGASAYAPENTVPAFTLAATQGATFVEIDLQRTKDGALVCLHDLTLERTTDVEDLFPGRARPVVVRGETGRQWPLDDFTLAEVRRLDAGRWFGASFAGTRVPTFAEAIEAVRGRTGLYIELKAPERHPGIEAQMIAELRAAGLDQPWADARTPIVVQSFTAGSLERIATELRSPLPLHLLFGAGDAARWTSPEGLAEARRFVSGLSPDKQVIRQDPGLVARARALGLRVTPYTYRASSTPDHADVTAEMRDAIAAGVDGVITDNPDRMPR